MVTIDALGGGDIQLAFWRKVGGKDRQLITGLAKRQARALANRILHEIDHAEGKRAKRPSNPHMDYAELLPCLDCGRKLATACDGRSGRACPLAEEAA